MRSFKEGVGLWVFSVLVLLFVIPWPNLIHRIRENYQREMAKPVLSEIVFRQSMEAANQIFREGKEKGDSYGPEDFQRGILAIVRLQKELTEKYQTLRFSAAIERLNSSYGEQFLIPLREKMFGQGLFGPEMVQAQAKVMDELGLKPPIQIAGKTFAAFFKWLFLFAGPVSCFLAFFLFVFLFQVRGYSLKEALLTSPREFLLNIVFWPFALLANYPEGDVGLLKRYLKLKTAYTVNKPWGYRLSKSEEEILWKEARLPLERFDKKVQQTLAYSRVAALLSSIFIWLFVAPFHSKAHAAQNDTVIVKLNTSSVGDKQTLSLAMLYMAQKSGGLVMLTEKSMQAAYGPLWRFKDGMIMCPVGVVIGKGDNGARVEQLCLWNLTKFKFLGKFNHLFLGSYNQPIIKDRFPSAKGKHFISYSLSRVLVGIRANYNFWKDESGWHKTATLGPAMEFVKDKFTIHLHATLTKPYTVVTEWQIAF
ncbi:MAG TPA: hypothetical protein PKZ02_01555 [Candidatus Paceibacterota bacterium]|nr:hypothetical protein [Candidatus Paceibacterota bacterium]HRY76582.1 hypothetical protein [Candidatus Paceibacterota bacterium]